jgi:hypothetical protein
MAVRNRGDIHSNIRAGLMEGGKLRQSEEEEEEDGLLQCQENPTVTGNKTQKASMYKKSLTISDNSDKNL